MLTGVSGVVSQREWSQQPSPMPGEEPSAGVKVRLAPEGIITVSTEGEHKVICQLNHKPSNEQLMLTYNTSTKPEIIQPP